MKPKLISLLLIVLLFINGIGVFANPGEATNQEKIILSFSNLIIENSNNHVKFELEGTNSNFLKKDHYMVPTYLETFIFPIGTKIINIYCTPKNIQRQILTKELIKAPEPVCLDQNSIIKQVQRNVRPEAIDSWYEYDIGTGINNNERCVFVKIQVFPVQYKPIEKTIEWAKNVELEIIYENPMNPIFYDDEYSLIVLTPVDFKEELNNLISHKNNRGISTKLVTLEDIYTGAFFPVMGRDNPEKIKFFIKNAIENWGTCYVLLVGSGFLFPTRTTHVNVFDIDKEVFISDLYYADIYDAENNFCSWDSNENDIFGEYMWGLLKQTDNVDLYPDVYLGRLACVTDSEVTACVNKIITYETNKAFMQEWFNNLIVFGGDTFTKDYGDSSSVDEGEVVNEEIIGIMEGFYPERFWASNGKLEGVNGVKNISDIINQGAGFIDFSGHGNTDKWKTHPHNSTPDIWLPEPTGKYENTNIASLSNQEKLPIVVCSGCSTSQFNVDSNCFGWSIVSNPNGGGIGSFGPSGLAWGYMGHMVTSGLVEGLVLQTFESYKNESAITFGEMWSKAITNYIFPTMDSSDIKTIKEWQAFGDPSLIIAASSQPPKKPNSPDGPTSGCYGEEYTYSSSTTDPDEDKIFYWFDWGDGTNSRWLGPFDSGETIQASHKWMGLGSFNIRVKTKDIHQIQSEWSESITVLIKDEIPPYIDIVKPDKALYLLNLKIRRFLFRKPFIVGRIEINVDASDFESGIKYVEYYVDDKLQFSDSSYPYKWIWKERVFGIKTIKVLCYDNAGNSATDEIIIWKFF
jgi:hypothetical protein